MATQKTTKRRSALFSSMAMLLVAAVALGTATYAWFTNSPTATADSISIKTSTASGLLVKTADDSYFTSAGHWTTKTDVILNPVSVNMTGAQTDQWFTATADSAGNAISTSSAGTTANIGTGFAIKTTITAKTVDETVQTLQGTVTCESVTVSDYIRVAVVKDSDKSLCGIYSNAIDTTKAVTAEWDGSGTIPTADVSSTTAAIDMGEISTATIYDIYIWLEGQDGDCLNPLGTITSANISFDFTIS